MACMQDEYTAIELFLVGEAIAAIALRLHLTVADVEDLIRRHWIRRTDAQRLALLREVRELVDPHAGAKEDLDFHLEPDEMGF